MKCKHCGKELSGNELYCGNCGAKIDWTSNNIPSQPIKQTNNLMIIIIIIAAVVIFAACAVVGYLFMNNNKNDDENTWASAASASPIVTQTPSPTSSPSPSISSIPNIVYVTPEPTPQIIYVTEQPKKEQPSSGSASVVRNPKYDTYYDSTFNFSCSYPSHFYLYVDNNDNNRYTLEAPDGSAVQKIYARSNADGSLTVNGALADFKRSVGGSVDYETSGSDYFAVRMKNGGRYYYKYCKFKNGNVIGFELDFDSDMFSIYDKYVNDIYDSLQIY